MKANNLHLWSVIGSLFLTSCSYIIQPQDPLPKAWDLPHLFKSNEEVSLSEEDSVSTQIPAPAKRLPHTLSAAFGLSGYSNPVSYAEHGNRSFRGWQSQLEYQYMLYQPFGIGLLYSYSYMWPPNQFGYRVEALSWYETKTHYVAPQLSATARSNKFLFHVSAGAGYLFFERSMKAQGKRYYGTSGGFTYNLSAGIEVLFAPHWGYSLNYQFMNAFLHRKDFPYLQENKKAGIAQSTVSLGIHWHF